MLAGMFALAIFRIGEPDGRSCMFTCRPVIAHVGPETSGLGLAAAGSEHRYRRVVSVQLAPAKHVLLNRIHKWTEQIARTTYPASQRRAGYINSLAAVNLRLSIQRKMVCELRDDHMGQQTGSGKTAFNRPRWSRGFDNSVAARAGELRPHVANDLEAVGDVLEL